MNEIEALFNESISDLAFSRSEKREIKQKIKSKNLSKREIDFLRSRIFDLALSHIKGHENKTLVNWLEQANKALKTKKETNDKLNDTVCFSPGTACRHTIVNNIRAAEKAIDICVFTISDNEISDELIYKHGQHVRIRILTDNEKLYDRGSDIDRLAKAGITVKIDRTRHHMHHKFAIFDAKKLLTGSYNWTRSAALYNHENILQTNNTNSLKSYQNEFDNLWKQMQPY